MFNEQIQTILDKLFYLKLRKENEFAYSIMPFLYNTENAMVLFNKNSYEFENNSLVYATLADEEFEYVIEGCVTVEEKNIRIQVNGVQRFKNKRKSKRYDVSIPTAINYNNKIHKATIVNISDSGLLLSTSRDMNLEENEKINIEINGQIITTELLRKNVKTNKFFYGLRFCDPFNIINLLKTLRTSFSQEGSNVFVLLDSFDDVGIYKNLFTQNINISFINIISNCESFLVDYIDNDKVETLILDLNNEDSIINHIIKIGKYINVSTSLIILLEEDVSDELVQFIEKSDIQMIFKPFLESEIKRILLKMN